VFREGLRPPDPFRERHPFETARTQDGMSLKALSDLGPVVVACLPDDARWRKRMLEGVANARRRLEEAGVRLVLVHAGEIELPDELRYVARIEDPEHALYDAFELGEAAPGLLGRLRGRGVTRLFGAFRLEGGEVRHAFRPEKATDTPDYDAFS